MEESGQQARALRGEDRGHFPSICCHRSHQLDRCGHYYATHLELEGEVELVRGRWHGRARAALRPELQLQRLVEVCNGQLPLLQHLLGAVAAPVALAVPAQPEAQAAVVVVRLPAGTVRGAAVAAEGVEVEAVPEPSGGGGGGRSGGGGVGGGVLGRAAVRLGSCSSGCLYLRSGL